MKKKFSFLSIPSLKTSRHILDKFHFPIDATAGSYSKIQIIIKNSQPKILHKNRDIKDFSFVWITSGWLNRNLAHGLDLYLVSKKIPHTSTEYSASKVTDGLVFAINNLPVPDSVYISYSESLKELDAIESVCSFPLIIKDIRGSQGVDSFLIQNRQELVETIKKLPRNKRFLFQAYIKNDYDWGVMVANGIVVSGERSYPATGEFRNNLANGAIEKFFTTDEIPQEIKDLAINASAALGLAWSRTDIIIDKETSKPYILEVNRYPGVTRDTDEAQGAYAFLHSHIERISPEYAQQK